MSTFAIDSAGGSIASIQTEKTKTLVKKWGKEGRPPLEPDPKNPWYNMALPRDAKYLKYKTLVKKVAIQADIKGEQKPAATGFCDLE